MPCSKWPTMFSLLCRQRALFSYEAALRKLVADFRSPNSGKYFRVNPGHGDSFVSGIVRSKPMTQDTTLLTQRGGHQPLSNFTSNLGLPEGLLPQQRWPMKPTVSQQSVGRRRRHLPLPRQNLVAGSSPRLQGPQCCRAGVCPGQAVARPGQSL